MKFGAKARGTGWGAGTRLGEQDESNNLNCSLLCET